MLVKIDFPITSCVEVIQDVPTRCIYKGETAVVTAFAERRIKVEFLNRNGEVYKSGWYFKRFFRKVEWNGEFVK